MICQLSSGGLAITVPPRPYPRINGQADRLGDCMIAPLARPLCPLPSVLPVFFSSSPSAICLALLHRLAKRIPFHLLVQTNLSLVTAAIKLLPSLTFNRQRVAAPRHLGLRQHVFTT